MSTGNVVRRLCTQCGMHEITQCVRSGIPISSTQFSPLFIFQRGGACSKQALPYFFSATFVVSPAINRLACRSLCVSSAVHPLFVCRPLLFCLPHPAASSVAVLILLSVQKTYFRSVILPDGNLQTPLPESRQKMPQRAKNVCALRHRHLTDKKPRKNCGVFNYCAL